ncbi:ABC transporter ATP-binding protein [Salinicola rhizosphaerae]|uniref:Nitrate/sulfonate/bicarbonate ABC transporter ATP-binding protein n=1 Tax=Salinicola rhizosphaerae TaxID=1443141 RepID=A0ABQ3E458_9GAMM|nr:ABC transporter ATP-binding protein [Salinicola rhizosphaerae]GHB25802.1 nitrate/sulfonate/bicarbonate ABC transporter ATP-binding protein [Salinicola rhizosphaerae]
MTSAGLHIDRVSRRFDVDGRSLLALDTVSLDAPAGSFIALIGPSGCGKSTLLRMLAGLDQPTSGELHVGGETPQALQQRGALGIAFQEASLLPWRSVESNVRFPFDVIGRMTRADRERVREMIALVGLQGFEQALPSQLSGGMRQRVAIARALVSQPQLLLLDEPFGALDQILRRSMNEELQRLWLNRPVTTVMVTHSVDEAIFLADKVVVMSGRPGRIARVVDIPFPRERPLSLLASAECRKLEAELLALMFEGGTSDRSGSRTGSERGDD